MYNRITWLMTSLHHWIDTIFINRQKAENELKLRQDVGNRLLRRPSRINHTVFNEWIQPRILLLTVWEFLSFDWLEARWEDKSTMVLKEMGREMNPYAENPWSLATRHVAIFILNSLLTYLVLETFPEDVAGHRCPPEEIEECTL